VSIDPATYLPVTSRSPRGHPTVLAPFSAGLTLTR
jgi:hypothetical protein